MTAKRHAAIFENDLFVGIHRHDGRTLERRTISFSCGNNTEMSMLNFTYILLSAGMFNLICMRVKQEIKCLWLVDRPGWCSSAKDCWL